jgi:hypothetical protein
MRTSRRGLKQVPPFTLYGTVSAQLLQAAISLPVFLNNGVTMLLGRTKAYQMRSPIDTSVALTKSDGSSVTFEQMPNYSDLWSFTITNGQVYFVNQANQIWRSDGTSLTLLANSPKARFIENFFDHIVVSNDFFGGEYGPYRVRWSHLYDFDQWTPTAENEADYFDLTGWERLDALMIGTTAMAKLNDLLIVYTQQGVFGARYVGLPKVMQFFPIQTGIGCGLPYSFQSYRGRHYFFDLNERDFYVFDGAGFESIGGPILGYMEDTFLSTYDALVEQSSSFVYPAQQEIWWQFYTGTEYKSVVFNYRLKEWRTGTVPTGLTCVSPGGLERARTIDELGATTIDALSSIAIDQLDASGESPLPTLFFGRASGNAWRESVSGDIDGVIIVPSDGSPVMETNDDFGDGETVREYDTIVIHAKYTTTAGAGTGIKVYASARAYVDDTVSWTLLGTWTPALAEGRLCFEKISGRVFRLKFEFVGDGANPVRGGEWSMFVKNVYGAMAEK